jgi:hypothetical protein
MTSRKEKQRKINLPEGIDYTQYHSTSGMSTRNWGPHSWKFLFTSIMGRYPIKIKTEEHKKIAHDFKILLTSLSNILPCIFCRNSFEIFLRELPIEPFLKGRIELMYWLYLMKDKVNNKLIKQERKCYNDEKRRLKNMYRNKELSKRDYYIKIEKFKAKTFVTVVTPPFKQVLDEYESIRAVCSKKSLTCKLPK